MQKFTVKIGLVMVICGMMLLGGISNLPAIEIRSGDSGGGDFVVNFEPLKDVFQVGEPIKFSIKGNQTFYLYLFSIDEQRNEGVVILPNILQQYHKYKAGQEYIVPEKNVEFFSNKPGQERIVMVASTKKLDVDMGRYNKSGSFFTSSAEQVAEDVKALRFRRRGETDEKVTQELNVVIVGQGSGVLPPRDETPPVSGPAPSPNEGTAFISTDRINYRLGDTIKILYGADKPGFVNLYIVEPTGEKKFLTKKPVSGKEVYHLQAKAAQPQGSHRIIATYSGNENGEKTPPRLPGITDSVGKGIELIGDGDGQYAIYYFNIQ